MKGLSNTIDATFRLVKNRPERTAIILRIKYPLLNWMGGKKLQHIWWAKE